MGTLQLPISGEFNRLFPSLEACVPYVQTLEPKPFLCCLVNMSTEKWKSIIEKEDSNA